MCALHPCAVARVEVVKSPWSTQNGCGSSVYFICSCTAKLYMLFRHFEACLPRLTVPSSTRSSMYVVSISDLLLVDTVAPKVIKRDDFLHIFHVCPTSLLFRGLHVGRNHHHQRLFFRQRNNVRRLINHQTRVASGVPKPPLNIHAIKRQIHQPRGTLTALASTRKPSGPTEKCTRSAGRYPGAAPSIRAAGTQKATGPALARPKRHITNTGAEDSRS